MKAIYCVRDQGAETYTDPFTARADGEAKRQFAQLVNDREIVPGRFPEQFTLYRIGHFNEDSGELVAEPHKALGNGVEYVKVGDGPKAVA